MCTAKQLMVYTPVDLNPVMDVVTGLSLIPSFGAKILSGYDLSWITCHNYICGILLASISLVDRSLSCLMAGESGWCVLAEGR